MSIMLLLGTEVFFLFPGASLGGQGAGNPADIFAGLPEPQNNNKEIVIGSLFWFLMAKLKAASNCNFFFNSAA